MKKLSNVFFVGLIIFFLMLGLVNTLFFSDDINYLENRPANKVSAFSIESYLDGSFQKQLNDALCDQVPLALTMKKIYNYTNSYFENKIVMWALKGTDKGYSSFKGGLVFGEHIVYGTRNFDDLREYHEAKAINIKKQAVKHPDIKFYVYYIEKDTDIDFETNKKIGAYEYLKKQFANTNIRFSGFAIDNFDEFSEYFYKTDHHWNCYGSYKAYKGILEWMDGGKEAVQIINEHLLEYDFSGSKAAGLGATGIVVEKFPAYEYAYPEMKITIDGQTANNYGNQENYISQNLGAVSYGAFYGGDNGEIIFETSNFDEENLLIIGESYDNAILKLLASHYNKTFSIDLRYYESTFGKPFAFSEYVEAHDIDKVLLIGNVDYFTMEEFMLEE